MYIYIYVHAADLVFIRGFAATCGRLFETGFDKTRLIQGFFKIRACTVELTSDFSGCF